MESDQHKAASSQMREEFESLIRRSRRRGVVDPISVIDEYIGRKSLNDVQLFGLQAGIVFTFMSPLVLYGLKFYCALHIIKMDLPEQAIMNFCLLNMGSVMAFGFSSGVHTIVNNLTKKADIIEDVSFGDDDDLS